MSKKYGISHHNFGPYPHQDADAIHECLLRLSTAAAKAGFECFMVEKEERIVQAAFPHHSAEGFARFDRWLAPFHGSY